MKDGDKVTLWGHEFRFDAETETLEHGATTDDGSLYVIRVALPWSIVGESRRKSCEIDARRRLESFYFKREMLRRGVLTVDHNGVETWGPASDWPSDWEDEA